MIWDPFGTVRRALWIGGAQWAGKSTVARILAERYGVTAYHHDFAAAHGHEDRTFARRIREGLPPVERDPEAMWVTGTPEELASRVLAGFVEQFEWALDDLRALVSGRPVIAEGWGLRPELVAPIVDSPRRMIVMVPTPEFRRYQLRTLPRAAAISQPVSDPQQAQRNRLARDAIVADDAVRSARAHGIRVLHVDGSVDVSAVAETVAEQFSPYL
jgi:2-phosphoglycerate kinase